MIRTPAGDRRSRVTPATLALLRRTLADKPSPSEAPIPRRADDAPPLSFAQERMWFLEQLPSRPLYHIPVTLRLRGALDTAALTIALNQVVGRHESLRNSFPTVDGRPICRIRPQLSIELPLVQIPAGSESDRLAEVRRRAGAQLREPFDLAAGPLLRGCIFSLTPEDHVLALVLHHIVSDWWSMEVLVRELITCYAALRAGVPPPLDELPIQYGDFAAWQQDRLAGHALNEPLAYWKHQLAELPPTLDLPTDRPRPRRPSYRGGRTFFALDRALRERLSALSRREGVTLFMTLLAGFSVLLARYARQRDIVVATPVAGRPRRELEGLIGLFLNTLVLRTNLGGDPSFHDLLQQVRRVALDGYAHQDVPFERIVDALQPERDLGRTPLFQVMFALQDAARSSAMTFNGLELELMPLDAESAKFDLSMVVFDRGDELTGALEYSADLFDAETMARMVQHWRRILEAAVANPSLRVSQLEWLEPGERHRLLQEWNATARPVEPACLHQLVAAQAARTPAAVAVEFGGARLTYAELEARAAQLAIRMQDAGVGPEGVVGVCMERSLELVVGLLGTLKAGAAYLPLDPEYPAERLAFMLADAAPRVVLTQAHVADRLPPIEVPVWSIDAGNPLPDPGRKGEGGINTNGTAQPDNAAYIIYTSGSTGRPKGVVNTHRGIVNRLVWMQAEYGLEPGEAVLQKTPFSFDVSVWEFFWPLLAGGRLVLAAPGGHRDPDYLVRTLAEQRVTTVHFVPSMLALFLEADGLERLSSLRRIVCSGEALPRELAGRCRQRLPQASLYNLYGPTEAAVDVSAMTYDGGGERATVPIGKPVFNTSLYVLGPHGEPLPTGIPGELYLGGVQLARGYLNRPELTAERFVPDHINKDAGRLYRTGDLARWLPDGTTEFLGRLDHQVKLRGFRIELGEVEAVLSQHPMVRDVAVLVREPEAGHHQLVAYLVPINADAMPSTRELRAHLEERLPEYMIPARFVRLAALPLSPNGKLDRKALPAPDGERPPGSEGITTPHTQDQLRLAAIWKEVLHLDRVGIHDNFFALGGDSMRAVQVVSFARKNDLPLSLPLVFEHQTIATLAEAIPGLTADLAEPRTRPFQLVSTEDRKRLGDGLEDAYPLTRLQAGMLHHLASEAEAPAYHNVTALPVKAGFAPELMQAAVDAVVARHAVLRTSFELAAYSEPLQLVHASASLAITTADLRHLTPVEQEQMVDRWMEAEQNRLFDLTRPPLMRIHLLRTGADHFWFAATEVHAILDGWSFTSTVAEILGHYADLLAGEGMAMQPAPLSSFRDFVLAERRALESAESRDFWQKTLTGASAMRLPRVPQAGNNGEKTLRRLLPLADDVIEGIERLAQQAGVPLKSVLLAAHAKAMSLLSGRCDVLTGMVTNGRPEDLDGDQVRGLFLNTVPIVMRLEGQTWRALVKTVFEIERGILPHRRYPFGALQAAWGSEPMLETLFNYTNFHALENALQRRQTLEFVSLWKERAHTNQPLLASFDKLPGIEGTRLVLILTCDGTQLSAPRVDDIGDVYMAVLAAMAADPDARQDEMPQPACIPHHDPSPDVQGREEQALSASPKGAGKFAAPSTAAEEILARAWAEVFRLERVGVDENFFELGGDSILGIQIVARVNQAGIRITPKDLFEHQTIAGLASVAGTSRPLVVEPGPIAGDVPLTPIQHWFFELGLTKPHHWNQAYLLETPNGLDPGLLEHALQEVCQHHDALRHRFSQEGEGWRQTATAPEGRKLLTTIDLSTLSGYPQRRAIEDAAMTLQSSLSLERGPLVAALLMNLGDDQAGRLLLVIHHLVVDGVSWRIILEDLQRAYQQLHHGHAIALAPRTSSFRQWSHRLQERAASDAIREQLAFWSAPARREPCALPVDRDAGANDEASSAEVNVSLDPEQTSALLREIPAAYHTPAVDALITALVMALSRWTGRSRLLLDLEGHGRETLSEDLDLSRTVGWFTAIFPALIELPDEDPGTALKSVKEQLRQIPDRGLGFGLLRYLSADAAIRRTMQSLPRSEVVFNYAGQLDFHDADGPFKRAPEQAGLNHDGSGLRTHVLEVSAAISNGRLEASFAYSRNLHQPATIEGVAEDFRTALSGLIAHCALPGTGGYTPSDFPQAELEQGQLDRLLESLDALEERGAA